MILFALTATYTNEYLNTTTPRAKIFIAEDDIDVPSDQIKKELCIVTGADAGYYNMLYELIESIKATKHYNDVKIMVLDCGLDAQQVEALKAKFDCIVKRIDWDVRVKPGTPEHVKCLSIRTFLHKHFPGFRYYLWVDSDAWVQCEYALHRFVNLCVKQGLGMCKGLHPTKLTAYRQIPWKQRLQYMFKPALNGGVFCVDILSPYYKQWHDYVLELNKNVFFRSMWDEMTVWYVAHNNHLDYLKEDENYLTIYGLPVVLPNGLLAHPKTLKPVGVMHLMMHKFARTGLTPFTMHPLIKTDKPLTLWQRMKNIAKSFYWHRFNPPKYDKESVSIRYRIPVQAGIDKTDASQHPQG